MQTSYGMWIYMPLIGQNLHNYLTLARSRDVDGHVTIRLPIPHFLLVLHCDQAPISNSFRDIGLQNACPVQIIIAHARYHVTCTP